MVRSVMIAAANIAALAACLVYAFARGGRPEQLAAAATVAGTLLTPLAGALTSVRYQAFDPAIFVVDFAMLAVFGALALRTDRIWPIWTTALQMVAIAAHLAKLASAAVPPAAYWAIVSLWGFPIILTIMIGTASHHRRVKRMHAVQS